MSKELLYATNNPGKVIEVSRLLNFYGIEVVSPKDLEIDLDVAETGNSLEENAMLKAKGFLSVAGERYVLSDDTGLEIDALGGEPNIHVRRWKDGKTKMSDQEIIDYCLERMKNIPIELRGAQFRTVLVLASPDGKTEIFDGTLRGIIPLEPSLKRVEGFPFESLFFVPEWNMLLGEARDIDPAKKGEMLNHRERALQKAIPRIKELLDRT
jgi:XTP/dITP diphosphohydrolase